MKIFWKPYRVATCLYAMSQMMSPLSAATNTLPADIASRLDSYNVVWDTPSVSGSLESMPLGNGDITSNVWVEQNGDLMMYIGKSDNWSEATRLLKTGRVRISFTPNPFTGSDNYSQTLDLRKGEVEITAGTRKLPVNIKIWIDAENPVVNVQTDSKVPLEIACTSELLRPEAMTFIGGGDDPLSTSYRGLVDSPVKPHESADTFVSSPDRVRWYHRNESSFFKTILEKQNVGELADKYRDPYLHPLEQFWDCLNPIDYIAALTYDIEELKRLPADIIGNELVAEWEGVLSKLPPLPKSADGKLLLPAEEFGIDRNFENPQCYVIWPFKLYGVTQPDYELALNTFNMRKFKASNCWSQCAVQAARLGLSGEMAELLMHNAGAQDPSVRFPAFWNPGSDYVPDFDNGGVLAMAVQTMLVDNLGDSILVAQALPDGWEADFKLHAYGNTTVIGKAKGKKVESLDIFPASRAASVVYPEK
ncbi:MAG: hypothetical protein K2G52_10375 [Muribaculaceae bacterium]|nr:hypothetical protein [Muribaculaceae bacterium]